MLTRLISETNALNLEIKDCLESGAFIGPTGPEGPQGVPGTVSFDDLTDEQRESLRGGQGPQGETGKSGVYIGTEKPDDPDVNVWIDPDGDGDVIDEIVQQAAGILQQDLSQIKDDLSNKLPKSPTGWPDWTTDEQSAARERMNAQESYRHIATITIDADEVYNVGIARDENGEVFALSDVYIYGYIKKTGSNEQIAVAINTIYTDINAGNNIIKLPSSYKKYGAQIELNIKKHTYWRASAVSAIGVPDPNINAVTGNTSVSHRGASNVRKNEWDTLSALAFSTENVAFGIGTTFDIWGR